MHLRFWSVCVCSSVWGCAVKVCVCVAITLGNWFLCACTCASGMWVEREGEGGGGFKVCWHDSQAMSLSVCALVHLVCVLGGEEGKLS